MTDLARGYTKNKIPGSFHGYNNYVKIIERDDRVTFESKTGCAR
jgi:hypothetical protein